jgi:hypothetical protein
MAERTEDGEFDNILQMPPRPIVPAPPDECKTEEEGLDIYPVVDSIEQIKLSPMLTAKLESLRGAFMVCEKKDCPTCGERTRRFDLVVEQIKAELTPMNNLRRKMNSFQNENTILKTYIDTNEGPGTAPAILRKSQMKIET